MPTRLPLALGFAATLLAAQPVSHVPAPQARTAPFRARVEAFWRGVGEHAEPWRKGLLARDPAIVAEVTRELGAKLDALVPGLKFGANVGSTPDTLRIELSPGSVRLAQLLGREVALSLPRIPGIECAPWRPPADPSESLGTLGLQTLDPRDFRVACEWDGETPNLSLAVWHDSFTLLEEKDRATLANRLVERMLGAAMLERTPHEIALLEGAPADGEDGVLGGDELYSTLVDFLKSENFDAATPPELAFEYYGPPSGDFPRETRLGDLASGASRFTDLVADYDLNLGTETIDALAAVGAGAGYIGLTHSIERKPLDPESRQALIDLRDQVSGALDRALAAAHAGTVVGWGDGATREWIDVLFFDEEAALPILRATLAAEKRVTAAELYSFDRAKPEPLTKLK